MDSSPLPDLTDDFLRQGAEYLIRHARPISMYEEKAAGIWHDWDENYIFQSQVQPAVLVYISQNIEALAGQYTDNEWAGFIWQVMMADGNDTFRFNLPTNATELSESERHIALLLRRIYEFVLLPKCTRDFVTTLTYDDKTPRIDGACYMMGEDFRWLDSLSPAVWVELKKGIEYALASPSFTLQHSALHALGHLGRTEVEDLKNWCDALISNWLHKYDPGTDLEGLSPGQQQRLRRSAFLVEPSDEKREPELCYGRPVPLDLVFYARAALECHVL